MGIAALGEFGEAEFKQIPVIRFETLKRPCQTARSDKALKAAVRQGGVWRCLAGHGQKSSDRSMIAPGQVSSASFTAQSQQSGIFLYPRVGLPPMPTMSLYVDAVHRQKKRRSSDGELADGKTAFCSDFNAGRACSAASKRAPVGPAERRLDLISGAALHTRQKIFFFSFEPYKAIPPEKSLQRISGLRARRRSTASAAQNAPSFPCRRCKRTRRLRGKRRALALLPIVSAVISQSILLYHVATHVFASGDES